MSDATAPEAAPTFTEREMKHLVAAMQSLKSGPPEVDYTLFQKHGGFNTLKTAQNTWCSLKKKLIALNPQTEEGDTPKTPSKSKATPKKRTKKDSDGEDAPAEGEEGSAKKKAKAPHKTKATATATAEDGTEVSPKKKTPRKPPAKKATAAKKSEETVKDEDGDAPAAAEEPVVKAENGDAEEEKEKEKSPVVKDAKMEGVEE